jgi:hypothetical protein
MSSDKNAPRSPKENGARSLAATDVAYRATVR